MSGWHEYSELDRAVSPDGRFAIVTSQMRDDRCCLTAQSLQAVDGSFEFSPSVGLFAFQANGTVDYSVRLRTEARDFELRHFVIDPGRPGYRPAELSGIWKPIRELEDLLRKSQASPPYSTGEPPEGRWASLGTLLFFAVCLAVALYDPPRGPIARISLQVLSALMVAASLWGVWEAWKPRGR